MSVESQSGKASGTSLGGVGRVRRKLARWLDPAPAKPASAKAPQAAAPAPRADKVSGDKAGIEKASSEKTPVELASRPAGGYEPADPPVDAPAPEGSRHQLLEQLHLLLAPRTYLEVGVQTGLSLALSRTRSIGVDPDFSITSEVSCDVQLVRDGSDEFFARPDAVEWFDGVAVDLAFIDGMHLSEFALRDFMNAEKLMAPTGVVVLDDVMPQNVKQAARDRLTQAWAGDVYKVIDILREQRPDLTVIEVNTSPTGTAVVLGLDPTSTVLADNYEANLARCQAGDPQPVPMETMRRERAASLSEVVSSPVWERLVALRGTGSRDDVVAVLREAGLTG